MVVFLGDLCYNKIPEALKIKDLCKLQIRPLGHGIRRPSVQICTPQPLETKDQVNDLAFFVSNNRRIEEGGLEPEKARPSRDSPVDCRAGSGSRGLNEAPQTGGCRSAADAQVLPPQLLEILIWE